MNNQIYTLSSGVRIINCTPHPITFSLANGEGVETVPCSGIVLNATPVEAEVFSTHPSGASIVRTEFVAGPFPKELKGIGSDVLLVGSVIAAQAFPSRGVVSMVPSPGFERVAPDQKRMNPAKFNTFSK